MEIKYTVVTQDAEGKKHNVGYDSDKDTITKLINILLTGLDPNNLVDITIHPEIRK